MSVLINHPPITIHIDDIISPPLDITHLIAVQCGAGATKGDNINPTYVAGVQK